MNHALVRIIALVAVCQVVDLAGRGAAALLFGVLTGWLIAFGQAAVGR
jgi:hypothetical protein